MILLTAFLPFQGRVENGSRLLANVLDQSLISGQRISSLILPVVWEGHRERLLAAFEQTQPTLVLGLGEGSPDRIRLETIATNTAIGTDEEGKFPANSFLIEDGLAELASPLTSHPTSADCPWPLIESTDAGDFLCNATLYHSLAAGQRAGFLHLPILADQDPHFYCETLIPIVSDLIMRNFSTTSQPSLLI